MDKRRLKAGWTRVQAGTVRIGEWVHTEDGQQRVIGKDFSLLGPIQLRYLSGDRSPWLNFDQYITVNYPRP